MVEQGNFKDKVAFVFGGAILGLMGLVAIILKIVGRICGCF